MEIRKLEAMVQVARDNAETERIAWKAERDKEMAERLAWEEKKEAERRKTMELRHTTTALRKEKEMYDARYRSSELGSVREDDSVRRNSRRRAMSGSSETSLGRGTVDREAALIHQPTHRGT